MSLTPVEHFFCNDDEATLHIGYGLTR